MGKFDFLIPRTRFEDVSHIVLEYARTGVFMNCTIAHINGGYRAYSIEVPAITTESLKALGEVQEACYPGSMAA